MKEKNTRTRSKSTKCRIFATAVASLALALAVGIPCAFAAEDALEPQAESTILSVSEKVGMGKDVVLKTYTKTALSSIASKDAKGFLASAKGGWTVYKTNLSVDIDELIEDAGADTWVDGARLEYYASDGLYSKYSPTYAFLHAAPLKWYPASAISGGALSRDTEDAVEVGAVLAIEYEKSLIAEGATAQATFDSITPIDKGLSMLQGLPESVYTDPDAKDVGGNRFPGGVLRISVVTPEDISTSGAVINVNKEYRHTGSAIEPEVTITDSYGNVIPMVALEGSTPRNNFTVEYKNNIEVGTATVTVKGDADTAYLTGELSATFKIIEDTPWSQIAGENRYETMEKIVKKGFDGAPYAILASGEDFPDALAATGFAGVNAAPIILTASDSLSPEAAAELDRLGVLTVVIIGGPGAISDEVISELWGMGISGERIYGENRQETACEIFKYIDGAEWSDTAIITYGEDFPDALSVSPCAYASNSPIFLTQADGTLDDATAALIKNSGFSKIVIVGGSGIIPDSVAKQVGFDITDKTEAVRLSGDNRYETSAAIAKYAVDETLCGYANVAVATGNDFPDALAGSVLQGLNGSVLLLVDEGEDGSYIIENCIEANAADIEEGIFLGGDAAVTPATQALIRAACVVE